MTENGTDRDRIAELADSSEERERSERAWEALSALDSTEIGAEPTAERSARMVRRFEEAVRAEQVGAAARPGRRTWFKAAAIFGVGLLTGTLIGFLADRSRETRPLGAELSRETARAAVSPLRSAAERLSAVHRIGDLSRAQSSSWARQVLVERVIDEALPAVQLAAIDHLLAVELAEDERERLIDALPQLESPIVQLTLIDLLIAQPSGVAQTSLEQLAADERAEALVRRYAADALTIIRNRSTT